MGPYAQNRIETEDHAIVVNLNSNEQEELWSLTTINGPGKVTERALEMSPAWIK